MISRRSARPAMRRRPHQEADTGARRHRDRGSPTIAFWLDLDFDARLARSLDLRFEPGSIVPVQPAAGFS